LTYFIDNNSIFMIKSTKTTLPKLNKSLTRRKHSHANS